MNKEQIIARLNEIVAELEAEIETLDEIDDAVITALEEEERKLRIALEVVERREKLKRDINGGGEGRKFDSIEKPDGGSTAAAEKRGNDLKERRTVTIDGGTIVVPKHSSDTVNPAFNEISSLIDRVKTVELPNGEAYRQPYLKSYGTGDYTAEGQNYADAEPVFGYADIGKTKVTAYSEDTEELQKLPAANYDAIITDGITKALRRKITREIMIGDGTAGHFTGIFANPADAAIDPATDISVAAIDENTLDQIVFTYGGSEEVEDSAVLILNKLDLYAFAKVKGVDKRRTYEIKVEGNGGTINGIPYILNSACAPISDAGTAAGTYSMAYGSLSNYQAVIFSGIDIQRSTDYKFKQGDIAHRGSVMMGGNVVAANGFLRVKKGA